MSDHNDGGPAFPQAMNTGLVRMSGDGVLEVDKEVLGGMSLRDWFAGQALASLSGDINPHLPESRASGAWPEPLELAERRATWTYLQADAMLAARNSTKGA